MALRTYRKNTADGNRVSHSNRRRNGGSCPICSMWLRAGFRRWLLASDAPDESPMAGCLPLSGGETELSDRVRELKRQVVRKHADTASRRLSHTVSDHALQRRRRGRRSTSSTRHSSNSVSRARRRVPTGVDNKVTAAIMATTSYRYPMASRARTGERSRSPRTAQRRWRSRSLPGIDPAAF